jgi:SPP1 family predicted phage head-tail adaptor
MLPRRLSNNSGYTSTGAMQHRVTLVQASTSRTATGEFVQSHEAVVTVWAAIQMLAQKYTEKEQKVITEATHKVTIRYMAGVTTEMLVQLADGRIWNIKAAVDPDERGVEIHLFCYERN